MKKNFFKRFPKLALAIFIVSMLIAESAYCWSAATHAYIEINLLKKQGIVTESVMNDRIYGSNLLDIFNDKFSSPYPELSAYLHDTSQDNFLELWETAYYDDEKPAAYGFVGHNNTWGMDSTAHISGITYGKGKGYVIAKAEVLASELKSLLESQIGPVPDAVMVNICHYLVESGVDLLVKNIYPQIGANLMVSAANRSPAIPDLLVAAYANDPDVCGYLEDAGVAQSAEQFIMSSEGYFKGYMQMYGEALTKDNALDIIAEHLAVVGIDYLGIPFDPDSDQDLKDSLVLFAKYGISKAMELCAPDFEDELEATTGWVNGKLSSKHISW